MAGIQQEGGEEEQEGEKGKQQEVKEERGEEKEESTLKGNLFLRRAEDCLAFSLAELAR